MGKGFQVPPECQGQIVEVAYMCAGDVILMRTTDRSDGSVSYQIAEIEADDWSWYETYEQANGSPPIADDRWQPIDARRVAAIRDDWA